MDSGDLWPIYKMQDIKMRKSEEAGGEENEIYSYLGFTYW